MTERRLMVLLGGDSIGAVDQGRDGSLAFTYDDGYRFRREATPLSVSMPLARAQHVDETVRPFLWGILPDNPDVLRRWGREHQVSDRNPFALLSVVGEDCAGAVQFVRPERLEALAGPEPVEWLAPDDIAAKIHELRSDPTAWQVSTATGQFSLAGAQPKVALHKDGGRWGVPRGRTPTTHILKPAVSGFDDHDLNEHLCLRLARAVGLTAAHSAIEAFGDERAVVIERYDRTRAGGPWRRVHQEDLCQALGLPPDQKYEAEGGPSVGDVVTLFQAVMPAPAAHRAVSEFVDAIILNWLIAGTDAHAKNYSILLSGSDVRFAPLYDLASFLPYEAHIPKLKLAMRIGGEYRLGIIERRHWERLAAEVGIDPPSLMDRIFGLADAVPDAIEQVAGEAEVVGLHTALPGRLAAGIRSWVDHCRQALQS